MKRLLAIVMVLVVIAGIFAGCTTKTKKGEASVGETSKSESEKTETSTGGETETSTDAEAESDNPNFIPTGLPIVKEKESFSLFADDGGLPEDKYMAPILEEQTNVEVEYMIFPHDIATEKKNILINSGDYPDVIGGWILNDADILNDAVNDDLYIELDGLIDKYAPKLLEALNYEGVREQMTLPDGHVYTIPYVVHTPEVSFSPFVQKDWLDQSGMEMPKTTEEFRELLRYFRDNDMDGDGDATNEIPFSGDNTNKNMNLAQLAGWFGKSMDSKGFTMTDGKLEFAATSQEYKDAILFLNSLYEEKLIDPELFTQDKAQWVAKGKEGIVGVNIGYGCGDWEDPILPGEVFAGIPLPVLQANENVTPQYHRGSIGSTVFRTQAAITDKATNPEVIIRWWDNAFEFSNSVQMTHGPDGGRIEILGEYQARRLDENLLNEEQKEKYKWENLFVQSLPRFLPPDFKLQPREGEPPIYEEKETVDALYGPYLTEFIPKAWVAPEDAKRLSTLNTDIENYIYQKQAEWVSGQSDIEADWDDYVTQLDKLGLPELLKIRQDAIAAMA